MTSRVGTSVIVKATTVSKNGEERTIYYGPFLPHVGSATTTFADELEHELEQSGRYASWDVTIETVFIGEGESDCAVTATR